MIKIGFVQGWDNDIVKVVVTEKYMPSFGDLLYTRVKTDSFVKTTLMEVIGFESQAPGAIGPIEAQPTILRVQERVVARARLFLEITRSEGYVLLTKASTPPALLSTVYLIRRGDMESEEIMSDISKYSHGKRGLKSGGVGVVVLRSGVAHNEVLARERHFMNATFNLDLPELIRKHVMIVGQTGSGKTSGIQGLLLKYALESAERIGWLIIDRHGEYVPPEGYVRDRFIGLLVDSIASNSNLKGVGVYAFRMTCTLAGERALATVPGYFDIRELPIRASSITFADFAALENVGMEKSSILEDLLTLLVDLFRQIEMESMGTTLQDRHMIIKSINLFMQSDNPEATTANMIALIPLLADNVVRYEGVGLPRKEKKGLHRVLVDRGIDARTMRMLRTLILSTMGWRARTISIGKDRNVVVLDDSKSLVKVAPVLKNPEELPCLLEALMQALNKIERAGFADYRWKNVCKSNVLEIRGEEGLSVDDIVRRVNEGNIVILDVSALDTAQADLAVLTIVRKIFEHRLELGVEESRKLPVVSLVSEEAPLYLSPERIKSPFNPFARIAREGRKFGVGLIAITQLATMIEKQLLGNFNTLVVMRTRSRGDIEFFRDLGIPVETLPFLGDRECFIYTPDLPIKEPIPAYMPAWFDEDYKKLVEQRRGVERSELKVSEELAKVLE